MRRTESPGASAFMGVMGGMGDQKSDRGGFNAHFVVKVFIDKGVEKGAAAFHHKGGDAVFAEQQVHVLLQWYGGVKYYWVSVPYFKRIGKP